MMVKELNFNDIPKILGEVYAMVADIQTMVGASLADAQLPERNFSSEWFDLEGVSKYLQRVWH